MLVVDPSNKLGAGAGQYELYHGGKPVWNKQLPFTLHDLRVSDQGEIAGYSYTEGRFGRFQDSGDLVVAIIGADGYVHSEQSIPRTESRVMHAPATPTVAEALIDVRESRMYLQIQTDPTDKSDSTTKVWRGWNIRSGQEIQVAESHLRAARKNIVASKRPDPQQSSGTPKPLSRITSGAMLQEIRRIPLVKDSPTSLPPFSILRFQFDDAGRIGFLQDAGCCNDSRAVFWIANPEDGSFKPIPLNKAVMGGRNAEYAVYLGGTRWLLFATVEEKARHHLRTVLDTDSGKTVFLGKFPDALRINHNLTSRSGKGFAFYSDQDRRVHCMTPEGRVRGVSPLFESIIQGLAMREGSGVDVLSGIDNQIHQLASDCSLVRSIRLESVMDRKLNYVADLEQDGADGWLLHDFHGTPPLYRLNPDASIRKMISPHFQDGRKLEHAAPIQRAPDGRIWLSDGAAFLRLDDNGSVDKVLGPSPEQQSLTSPSKFDVLPDGSYLVADQRNGWVHRLDSSGRTMKILKPGATDLPANTELKYVFQRLDGTVILVTDNSSNGKVISFSPDGTRAGARELKFDEVLVLQESEQSATQLGLSFLQAEVRDQYERTVTKVLRRADGAWLGHLDRGAMAPDGSFALLSSRSHQAVPGKHATEDFDRSALTFYDSRGLPVRTVQFNDQTYARLAFDGARAYLLDQDELLVVTMHDGSMTKHRLSTGKKGTFWELSLHAATATLHTLDGGQRVIRVFNVPTSSTIR